jgi:hypothetical protein
MSAYRVQITDELAWDYLSLLSLARFGYKLKLHGDSPETEEPAAKTALATTAQDRHKQLFQSAGCLPVLLSNPGKQGEFRTYDVTVAPIFAHNIGHLLQDRHEIMRVASHLSPGGSEGKEQQVLAVMQVLLMHALEQSEHMDTVELHRLFPFLKGKVENVSVRVDVAVPVLKEEDVGDLLGCLRQTNAVT